MDVVICWKGAVNAMFVVKNAALEKAFPGRVPFSPVSITAQMFHAHLPFNTILIRRTSEIRLGILKKYDYRYLRTSGKKSVFVTFQA
jgi:hypothetical protein